MRRRTVPSPSRRPAGGASRRRRHRHTEEAVRRMLSRRARRLPDLEDFIYESWGAFAADTASER